MDRWNTPSVREAVAGLIAGGWLVGLWAVLAFVVVPARLDREIVRVGFVRRCWRGGRGVLVRIGCQLSGWPHLVDVVRGVRRDSRVPAHRWERVGSFGPGSLVRVARSTAATKGPVLLVHSLVSRAWVLDLLEESSLAGGLLDAGHEVFILDWHPPGDARRQATRLGIVDLVFVVRAAEELVRHLTGARRVHVVGYCLGATVALLRAASWPEPELASVALIAPVVGGGGEGMGQVLGHPWLRPGFALDERGNVPGPLVREAFHWLRPQALRTVFRRRPRRHDRFGRRAYAAMASWTWEHHDLPGDVLVDMARLYREDPFVTGAWSLAGVDAPVLVLHAERDHIVPPPSSTVLASLLRAPPEVVAVPGGHVGMLVGANGATVLRPALVDFLGRHDSAPAAAEPPVPLAAEPHWLEEPVVTEAGWPAPS